MRWVLVLLALLGASFAAASCAVVDGVQAGVVDSFCRTDRDGWSPIAVPADAQTFRDALAQDRDYAEASGAPAYWFTRASGEVRLCHTALRRSDYIHPRVHDCDGKIATWWDFTRTENGPRTDGADFWVCVT